MSKMIKINYFDIMENQFTTFKLLTNCFKYYLDIIQNQFTTFKLFTNCFKDYYLKINDH